jgi:hypothetical protein
MIPVHTGPTSLDSPKRSITDLTISIPNSSARPEVETTPPRWNTLEFKVYGLVFLIVVPIMVYIPISLSSSRSYQHSPRVTAELQASHPNFHTYAHRLSPGWMLGRLVVSNSQTHNAAQADRQDNSDPQYRTFRSGLPALLGLATSHLAFSAFFSRIVSPSASSTAKFTVGFASIMLFVLHGISMFKIFAILGLNYYLARLDKPAVLTKVWPALVITGNMILLFLNHRYEGYKLGALHAFFDPLVRLLLSWHARRLTGRGRDRWTSPSLAYRVQHHHASYSFFLSGLSLETARQRSKSS